MAKPVIFDLIAPRRAFLDAIDACLPATSQSGGMPLLATLQVTALASGKIAVAGTDLLVSCVSTFVAHTRVPGSICVHAKLLRDIVAKMAEGDIAVTCDGSSVSVAGPGKRKATGIAFMPGEDFPAVPQPEGEPVTVPAAALAAVLKTVRPSMSTDDMRPHLACTFLGSIPGSFGAPVALRAVSTDGHRLTIAEARVDLSRPLPAALIPKASLDRIKLPAEGDLTLWLKGKEGPLHVKKGDTLWSTKTVDAAYPSFDQVLPQSWDMTVTCDRALLADAVAAVSTVASDRTAGVRLRVADGRIEVSSENPDRGAMADELACEIDPSPGSNRTGVYIGFNGRYVLDTLCALSGEQVLLRFCGELDPCRVEDATAPGFVAVWMPMRIGE